MPGKVAFFRGFSHYESGIWREETLCIRVADELFSAGGLGLCQKGGKCLKYGIGRVLAHCVTCTFKGLFPAHSRSR